MPLLSVEEVRSMAPVFQGKYGGSLARTLMHILSVDKVNDLYDRNSCLGGPAFAEAILADIGLEYSVETVDDGGPLSIESLIPDGPFITISNHPCGHVDGISLVDIFGHVRPDYKVMVNNILGRIEAMGESFITVTPTGTERTAPTSSSISGIRLAMKHLREGGSLGLFPSGAVSDFSLKNALGFRPESGPGAGDEPCTRDREWQEPVIRLIRKAHVPVIPVRFLDGNSPFYYSLGLIDWRVRLLRLIPEVFNKKGKRFRIVIGPVITPQMQDRFFADPSAGIPSFGAWLRSKVYSL